MPCELGDAGGVPSIRCRSLYRTTIEAASRYVVHDLKDVATWKRFRTHEPFDTEDAHILEHLSSMSFFPKRASGSKKSKQRVCSESSRDSLWPVDDEDEDESGEVFDTSGPPVSVKSRPSLEKSPKPTVDAFVEAMRRHRSVSKSSKSDSETAFVESRYRLNLSRLDVAIEATLVRASDDARLPSELRELLPILQLYSYDADYEPNEQASTWSVHLSVDRELALRNHRFANGAEECRASYRARLYDEQVSHIDIFRVWNTECAPDSVRDIKDGLAFSATKAVWKKRSLRFTDPQTFAIYLMLHSLATWQDTKDLLAKPEREYFALLTLMLHRYPTAS
ncbi:hypothetical protein CYMTET_47299 [Cymbomonas tetramitiformis]|uniref:Uncharacterized protein n=1 Tax=Cymbomonas tetramitiformis TaxID=36881 RepID=A0AAE0BW92_9CHLO|nr:hypothetical protein CYMTET_47299 [Cymbomonas tetramitiformis]